MQSDTILSLEQVQIYNDTALNCLFPGTDNIRVEFFITGRDKKGNLKYYISVNNSIKMRYENEK